MVVPNKDLLDRTKKIPTIRIDNELWPIPRLAPAQNEIVLPIVLGLWPKITKLRASKPDDLDATFEQLNSVIGGEGLRQINDCVFLALQRGHKDLTREYFDSEMGVGIMEAVEALSVIAMQTGLIKMVPAGMEGPKTGEA